MKFYSCALLFIAATAGPEQCRAFTSIIGSTATTNNNVGALRMFFADDVSPAEKKEEEMTPAAPATEQMSAADLPPLELIMSDNENFLNAAGAFLVDAFWLNSKHHQIDDASSISDEARLGLIVEQSADLQEKYGEVMGKRLANGAVIAALDPETRSFIGVVTLKETLMKNGFVLEAEKAEAIARNAVASLGPKDRRAYKNAPISKIAEECLPADTKSVCVLSNLAVSPDARRRGVANALCNEVDALVEDWGYNEVHLLVEAANEPARTLYQEKNGYRIIATKEGETALRADINAGEFKEIAADTLLMVKTFRKQQML